MYLVVFFMHDKMLLLCESMGWTAWMARWVCRLRETNYHYMRTPGVVGLFVWVWSSRFDAPFFFSAGNGRAPEGIKVGRGRPGGVSVAIEDGGFCWCCYLTTVFSFCASFF